MFGKGKMNPAEALYLEQKSRNEDYRQTYEYRTISANDIEKFDVALNRQAEFGWELVSFLEARSEAWFFYGVLRRPRHP